MPGTAKGVLLYLSLLMSVGGVGGEACTGLHVPRLIECFPMSLGPRAITGIQKSPENFISTSRKSTLRAAKAFVNSAPLSTSTPQPHTIMPPKSFKPTRERKARKRVRAQEEGGEKQEAFPDGNNPARSAPNSNAEIIIPGTAKPERPTKNEPELPKMSAKKRKRYNKYIVHPSSTPPYKRSNADPHGVGEQTQKRQI
jgi:hypothetical protein